MRKEWGKRILSAFMALVLFTGVYFVAAPSAFADVKDISQGSISAIPDQEYTGSEIIPAITVSYEGNDLIEGEDYTVSYSSNIIPGTASITVSGSGDEYTGTLSGSFTITPKDISELSADPIEDQVYTGRRIKPLVVVRYGDRLLSRSIDYVVTYLDNVNPGEATAVITGTGNYKGQLNAGFNILSMDISEMTVKPIITQTYTGEEIRPKVVVKDGNAVLTENVDYVVEYADNVNVGEAQVIVTGIGKYTGTNGTSFDIQAKKVYRLTIDKIPNQTYTGSKIEPGITVRDGDKVLIEGTDYTVEYSDNRNLGTADVNLIFKGNYSGTKRAEFKIVPCKIAAPKAVRGLVYNGTRQTGVKAGTGYTLAVNRAKHAGSYVAMAYLKYGYEWDDGTVSAKGIRWSIAKAEQPVEVTTVSKKVSRALSRKQNIIIDDAIQITGARGKVSYHKIDNGKSAYRYISIINRSRTGADLKMKKHNCCSTTKTHTILVRIRVAATKNYKAYTTTVEVCTRMR